MRYGIYDAAGKLLRYEYIKLEDEPTVQGSLWNRVNVLPDDLVSLLGLPYEDPQLRHALAARPSPIKIASYETAGAYEWVAPDLADGKPYKIGVLIIGGGGCGGLSTYSSSTTRQALGGASGYSETVALIVTPGEAKTLVVGKGGSAALSTSSESGGASSFDGATADGGAAGLIGKDNDIVRGAAPSTLAGSVYGTKSFSYDEYGVPAQRINLFENKPMLGGGGTAWSSDDGETRTYSAGKNPITGLGGGSAAASATGEAIAEDATEPGCGGGGAIRREGYDGRSGAGADGAVYIYFLGVVEE